MDGFGEGKRWDGMGGGGMGREGKGRNGRGGEGGREGVREGESKGGRKDEREGGREEMLEGGKEGGEGWTSVEDNDERARGGRCAQEPAPDLSHRMYLLITFRKSTLQLIVHNS